MSGERTGQELVVVGVDGSAESVRALGWAARYATATGARVQALLAWHYPDAAGQPPVEVAPEPVRCVLPGGRDPRRRRRLARRLLSVRHRIRRGGEDTNTCRR